MSQVQQQLTLLVDVLYSLAIEILHLLQPFKLYILSGLVLLLCIIVAYGSILLLHAKDPVVLFKKLSPLPFGLKVFSYAIGFYAPYTGMLDYILFTTFLNILYLLLTFS